MNSLSEDSGFECSERKSGKTNAFFFVVVDVMTKNKVIRLLSCTW